MSRQYAQPLICDARIFSRWASFGSMLLSWMYLSRPSMAWYAPGETLAGFKRDFIASSCRSDSICGPRIRSLARGAIEKFLQLGIRHGCLRDRLVRAFLEQLARDLLGVSVGSAGDAGPDADPSHAEPLQLGEGRRAGDAQHVQRAADLARQAADDLRVGHEGHEGAVRASGEIGVGAADRLGRAIGLGDRGRHECVGAAVDDERNAGLLARRARRPDPLDLLLERQELARIDHVLQVEADRTGI